MSRTYPELDVNEMLEEAASSSPEDPTSATPTDTPTTEDEPKGYSQAKLPLSSLGITAIVVVSLVAVVGIWEYFPSDKQQMREAKSRVEKLEASNAALEQQLESQEALTRLTTREVENQAYTQEVMLKDIRACAAILRPYGGNE